MTTVSTTTTSKEERPMRTARLLAAGALVAGALALPLAPQAQANADVVRTDNVSHVANLQYPVTAYPQGNSFNYSETLRQGGTDLETVTLTVDLGNGPEARDFVVGGSYRNGVQLIDVTDPENPVIAQTYSCGIAQGDVQIFERAGRTYLAYAQDDISSNAYYETTCFKEGFALTGESIPQTDPEADAIRDRFGTFIIDITNPYATEGPDRVRTVGWARAMNGSHNATVSPDGLWLYNSNQDLIARTPVNGQALYKIEVFSLAELTSPQLVAEIPLSTGAGPHDITFNADGTRAFAASVTHTVVIDTTDHTNPSVIGVVEDPAITIHHQADPVEINDRTFLVISDELAGVIEGSVACPGGGLHIYDVTGALERTPVKIGYYAIPQVAPPGQHHARCTAHVFRAYPERGIMTIAWYGAGVRVLDISNLTGVSAGVDPAIGSVGNGITELGSFYFEETETQVGSQVWAAKIHAFNADGSAYIFANDLDRGFDVFRFDPSVAGGGEPGQWLPSTQAPAVEPPSLESQALPVCVILSQQA